MTDGDKTDPPKVSEQELDAIKQRVSELHRKSDTEHEAFLKKVLAQFEQDYSGIQSRTMRASVLDYVRDQLGETAKPEDGI